MEAQVNFVPGLRSQVFLPGGMLNGSHRPFKQDMQAFEPARKEFDAQRIFCLFTGYGKFVTVLPAGNACFKIAGTKTRNI
jgi:hypothetical protein